MLLVAILATSSHAQLQSKPATPVADGPQFTADERQQIVTFWADPSRYREGPPDDYRQKGLWQVRLTPEGSVWLWNYDRVRKVSAPPTAVAQPANDQQRPWETWLTNKLAYDRWQAWQTAFGANRLVLGSDFVMPSEKGVPDSAPVPPGPEPPDMVAAVGDPPVLARAVVPMAHTITFDDATIQFDDNTHLGNPRYPYYRFAEGVESAGTPVAQEQPDRLSRLFQLAGCSDSEARVMRAVSVLEGGFDAVNTYDTGYVSVGFIQFASLREGAGSLGALLSAYKQDDPTDFAADFHRFGVEVQPSGALDVVDPVTGAEVSGPDANARIIADKRLIAVFQRAGEKSDSFCAAQVKSAKAQFFPANDSVTITTTDGHVVTGKVCDFIRSEAGMAILFDRKVNTGNISLLLKVATQVASSHHCTSVADLAGYEREILGGLKYRTDFTLDPTLSQPGN